MGIYISGIEIPTGNCSITLKLHSDAEVEIIDEDENWKTTKAIFVPSHGRLGDLDLLEEKAIERSEKFGKMVNIMDRVITVYDIESASTIIPGNKEK